MSPRNGSRSRPAGVPTLIALAGGLLLFAAGWWLGGRMGRDEAAPVAVPIRVQTQTQAADEAPLRFPDPPAPEVIEPPVTAVDAVSEPERARARIAIVIDDLGRSVSDLSVLETFGVPLAYSVLPFEVLTAEVVAEINRNGWEMLCHLPMEPRSGVDPGPGALTSMMSTDELAAATRAALSAVPGAVGVNNHMGSTLSADERSMNAILEVVGERGMFYLDSRTSAESVAYRSAIEHGIPAAERQVFIDAEIAVEAIEEQFDRLLRLASERGAAVAIAHPHRPTLEVLAYRIPDAVARGYEFVPVSFLLDRPAAPVE